MNTLISEYNSSNYILSGENDQGLLLHLRSTSTNSSGKIEIFTPNNKFNLLFPDNYTLITRAIQYPYVVQTGPLANTYNYNTSLIYEFSTGVTLSISKSIDQHPDDTHRFTIPDGFGGLLGYQTLKDNIIDKTAGNSWISSAIFVITTMSSTNSTGNTSEIGYVADVSTNLISNIGIGFNNALSGNILRLDGTIVKDGLSGVGFELDIDTDTIIDEFQMFDTSTTVRLGIPMRYGLYAYKNGFWTELYYTTSGHLYNTRNNKRSTSIKNLASKRFVLLIQSVHIREIDYPSYTWNNPNSIIGKTFSADISYIEIFTSNKLSINTDIDLSNQNIFNAGSIDTSTLILNGISYTSLLSQATIDDNVISVISTYAPINAFISLFNPTITLPEYNPLETSTLPSGSEYLIPFAAFNGDKNILIKYRKNVNIEPIIKINSFKDEGKNGIIYINNSNIDVSNKFDLLSISSIHTNSININSNILSWNNDIYRFTHTNAHTYLQDGFMHRICQYPPDSIDIISSNLNLYLDSTDDNNYISEFKFQEIDFEYTIRSSLQSRPATDANIIDQFQNGETINYYPRFFGNTMLLIQNPTAYYLNDHINSFPNSFNGEMPIQIIDGVPFDLTGRLLSIVIDGQREFYVDYIELEFGTPIVPKYMSMRIKRSTTTFPPGKAKLLCWDNGWRLLLDITGYTKDYNNDIMLPINISRTYSRFRLIIQSLYVDKNIQSISTPRCEFGRFKIYGYTSDLFRCKMLQSYENLHSINLDPIININNHVNILDDCNITRLVVNDDFQNSTQYDTYSTVHINTFNNEYDVRTNALRLALRTEKEDLHNTVIHGISRDVYDNTHYHIDVSKNYYDFSIDHTSTLNIANRCVGINHFNQDMLEGLNVFPSLNLFDEAGNHISIASSPNTETYNLRLPLTKPLQNYLLRVKSISNDDAELEWVDLAENLFTNKNIYIGKIGANYSIFDMFTTSQIDSFLQQQNLIHIRKLLVGRVEDFQNQPLYLNKSDPTNLLAAINNYDFFIAGQVYATQDIQTDSDIRYKENLERLRDPIGKIRQLNGYTFDRKDTYMKRRFTGLVAQEIQKVLPEAVLEKHDGGLRVMYGNLAGLFVEAIKDLQDQIDDLKKRLI